MSRLQATVYINSGYRAQEFLIYVYDLLPAILQDVMPETYWTTFCKLCAVVKIVLQRRLTRDQLARAHVLILEFAVEFKAKFVQRKASRIHFVRPCIHNITHIPSSTIRSGPHGLYSQYTIERTIGNIVEEIKQHTTPSANASQRAIRRAQVNTVKALLLEESSLEPSEASTRFPRIPAGNGYTILWPRDQRKGIILSEDKYEALSGFFAREGSDFTVNRDSLRIKKWGRLQLPSGDVVRSAWNENKRSSDEPIRITRMVKFQHETLVRFGEILFYFVIRLSENEEPHHLAMISMTSLLDHTTLEKSSGALMVCNFVSGENLVVTDVSSIQGGVSILLFPLLEGDKLVSETKHFVIENFGRYLSRLTESTAELPANGHQDEDDEEGEDND